MNEKDWRWAKRNDWEAIMFITLIVDVVWLRTINWNMSYELSFACLQNSQHLFSFFMVKQGFYKIVVTFILFIIGLYLLGFGLYVGIHMLLWYVLQMCIKVIWYTLIHILADFLVNNTDCQPQNMVGLLVRAYTITEFGTRAWSELFETSFYNLWHRTKWQVYRNPGLSNNGHSCAETAGLLPSVPTQFIVCRLTVTVRKLTCLWATICNVIDLVLGHRGVWLF